MAILRGRNSMARKHDKGVLVEQNKVVVTELEIVYLNSNETLLKY